MRPQNIKNFHFLVKSRPAGATPFTDFNFFRGFYMLNYATFQAWHDSLHRLRSYCWETARRSIRPNFSVHPVGKTMRWIEKWIAPFLMAPTSSITMQSLGKIIQHAPGVGAKTWCLYVFFCHTQSPEHRAFVGCIVRTSIALPFIARFWRCFQRFFARDWSFRRTT